jgi:DNA-binding response OmpR family regulator
MKQPIVLVIDDDQDIRNAVSQALEESDLKPQIFTARNATQGLQLAKTHVPDVVVLDLQMPLGTGFDFVTELKLDRKLRSVKVLMLTASDTTGNLWNSIDQGIDDFMSKPFDIGELEVRVTALVGKERAGSGTI